MVGSNRMIVAAYLGPASTVAPVTGVGRVFGGRAGRAASAAASAALSFASAGERTTSVRERFGELSVGKVLAYTSPNQN